MTPLRLPAAFLQSTNKTSNSWKWRANGKWIALTAIYAFWVALAGRYLWNYICAPAVAGVDGSGHVAAVALYARHGFPHLDAWLPEFFRGMPFPTFYPPLFYFVCSGLVWSLHLTATTATKSVVLLGFVLLPYVLFRLCRSCGLNRGEAVAATCFVGALITGLGRISLFSVGLLGTFEIGLYPFFIGFVFFCVWFRYFPNVGRFKGTSARSTLALCAVILLDVHLYALVATMVLGTIVVFHRQWLCRSADRPTLQRIFLRYRFLVIPIISLLLTAFWWIPLTRLSKFAIGLSQQPGSLFASFGAYNLLWIPPIVAIALEWKSRRPLAALSLGVLLAGLMSFLPVNRWTDLPFQPWRLASTALLLATIPSARLLNHLLYSCMKRNYAHTCTVAIVLAFTLATPRAHFDAAAITKQREQVLQEVRSALRGLPDGRVLVEIVDQNEKVNLGVDANAIKEQNETRALAHQIATDGRPIAWALFRELSLSAPLNTAVRNLFSSYPEGFDLGGSGVSRSLDSHVEINTALNAADHLGIRYYLVKTPLQVARLHAGAGFKFLWRFGDWSCFASNAKVTAEMEPSRSVPVMAWLPAAFRNRSENQLDFFNVGEDLVLDGHPEIPILLSTRDFTSTEQLFSTLNSAIVVIDEKTVPDADRSRLAYLLRRFANKLEVIYISGSSVSPTELEKLAPSFRRYKEMAASDTVPKTRELLSSVESNIEIWEQHQYDANPRAFLWVSGRSFFPDWRTRDNNHIFLTAQGGMAVLSDVQPHLIWQPDYLRKVGVVVSGLTVVLGLFLLVRKKEPAVAASAYASSPHCLQTTTGSRH